MSVKLTNELHNELAIYQRLNLPLLFWERLGDNPNEWKGPHIKGWNDPGKTYDITQYDPNKHNLGVLTGREIAPGKALNDIDFDKLNTYFVKAFFPPSAFALGRDGKELSHLLYTTPKPYEGRLQYKSPSDEKPYIELRGTGLQTMVAPSLHSLPDVRIKLVKGESIGHTDLVILEHAALDYSIAMLTVETFPGGLHHDERLALAGYLLKRKFHVDRVVKLLETICGYQVQCRVPDMSHYDVKDSRDCVQSTYGKLQRGEKVEGSGALREVNPGFTARLSLWLPNPEGPVSKNDFYAYMVTHTYIFVPSRELWPGSSVNSRVHKVKVGVDPETGEDIRIPASLWLDQHRPVEQMTWAPGLPMIIADKLVSDGGWIDHPGCNCYNLYRPPYITHGQKDAAQPWVDLVHAVYPDHASHILAWLAHRVQKPQEKINHALVLGGIPGIGKDSILEPVKTAIGPWNFAEVSPKQILGRFNGFVKSVILRISEVRDLGELTRYDFYEHMKVYTAAPPDVIRVDEKHLREYAVFNVCGLIYTTNHETDGMYLPPEDRRHFVTWSTLAPSDFSEDYWKKLYNWYETGGRNHVAAYLASYDLSKFNPKAPPEKTEAFWAIVDANRTSEDAELADLLDTLANPDAVTLTLLANDPGCEQSLSNWLTDRKNSRQIPHRLKSAGYVPYRNDTAKDGMWKINEKRQVVYVKAELSVPDRRNAIAQLASSDGKIPTKKVLRGTFNQ